MTVLLAGATGCILVDRFHELAPDEDLALVPANDGGDDAPPSDAGGRDVTLEASDAALKAANVTTATREQKRLFDFSVRVSIKRPGEAASAPAGASAPLPGAAPRPAKQS